MRYLILAACLVAAGASSAWAGGGALRPRPALAASRPSLALPEQVTLTGVALCNHKGCALYMDLHDSENRVGFDPEYLPAADQRWLLRCIKGNTQCNVVLHGVKDGAGMVRPVRLAWLREN